MTETIRLPDRLDLSTIGPLADTLRQHIGTALGVDASGVSHMGGLGAQVLLSAAVTWRATGQPLTLIDPSPEFVAQAAELGLSPADFKVAEDAHVD
jgi:chemotaxis protein CheX